MILRLIFIFLASYLVLLVRAEAKNVAGFNLTESQGFVYDANPAGAKKSLAQKTVDQAQALGANHIILNVRATMTGPYATEIVPITPPAERSLELKRMMRLIQYVHGLGMTVGIRPIFFVIGPSGEFPYSEKQPDGSQKVWWHGNIQPRDPNRWFESFRTYLDMYLTVAQFAKVDEFTIAAELYSMTVGIEDQWHEYPYGFPGRWLELLRYVRMKLPAARLMYDANFTDDKVQNQGLSASGGEFERWRYRLVDLANVGGPEEHKIWLDLASFWKELDAIGIDMYRSLASSRQQIPRNYNDLVGLLKQRADAYATQMDTALTQISLSVGVEKPLMMKEVGFRSVDKGFIDPFIYAGEGVLNITHQAAAYEAVFESFWKPNWPWFQGINFWDIAVDPSRQGATDVGFSPLGKKETENVIRRYF